jgi:hypothetical protein
MNAHGNGQQPISEANSASLPKEEQGQLQVKREQCAKARKLYRDRKVRWKRLVDALEEKALKLACDDACDLLALVRLGTLVKECRELGNRERALRYSQRKASDSEGATIQTNGTGNRALTPETLEHIETLAKLM